MRGGRVDPCTQGGVEHTDLNVVAIVRRNKFQVMVKGKKNTLIVIFPGFSFKKLTMFKDEGGSARYVQCTDKFDTSF